MAEWLRARLAGARTDEQGLQARIHQCVLAECGGQCCCDGAYLEADEPEVLAAVVRQESAFFARLGVDVEGDAIVAGARTPGGGVTAKTATKPDGTVTGDGAAACLFRVSDGRSSLQVLAAESGRHPWFYKPAACWLHPLDVFVDADGPCVGLFRGAPPPLGSPPSVGSAPCSRRSADGPRAIDALGPELNFLSGITGWAPPG